MIVLKLYYHLICLVKTLFYRLIYGKSFTISFSSTYRTGFHVVIEHSGGVKIGRHCFFNHYCTLASRAGITIGDGSIFGENVKVYDHNHRYQDTCKSIKEQGYTAAPITIGKHCWIGSGAVILKGVNIGDNCVIGAGCVVYKDVPANTLLINKQEWIKKSYQDENPGTDCRA